MTTEPLEPSPPRGGATPPPPPNNRLRAWVWVLGGLAAVLVVVLVVVLLTEDDDDSGSAANTTTTSTTAAPTTTAPTTTSTTSAPTTTAPPTSTTLPLPPVTEDPQSYAQYLFVTWQNGDRTSAANVASADAVNQMFSQAYNPATNWTFNMCDPAAGSLYCTWSGQNNAKLTMQVRTLTGGLPIQVLNVQFG
jgi:hypothetical protein